MGGAQWGHWNSANVCVYVCRHCVHIFQSLRFLSTYHSACSFACVWWFRCPLVPINTRFLFFSYVIFFLSLSVSSFLSILCCSLSFPLSQNGDTPLHLAYKHGHDLMIELLLHHRANPDIRNKQGLTYKEVKRREVKIKLISFFSSEHHCNKTIVSRVRGSFAALTLSMLPSHAERAIITPLISQTHVIGASSC